MGGRPGLESVRAELNRPAWSSPPPIRPPCRRRRPRSAAEKSPHRGLFDVRATFRPARLPFFVAFGRGVGRQAAFRPTAISGRGGFRPHF